MKLMDYSVNEYTGKKMNNFLITVFLFIRYSFSINFPILFICVLIYGYFEVSKLGLKI